MPTHKPDPLPPESSESASEPENDYLPLPPIICRQWTEEESRSATRFLDTESSASLLQKIKDLFSIKSGD